MPPTDQEGKVLMCQRIQRRRVKGWKMPPNSLAVTRPGEFGNPFQVGGYFKLGNGGNGMAWLQALSAEFADSTFTRIETAEQAVEMFREYRQRYPFSPEQVARLKSADYLACWCNEGRPCHADVLLEIANG